jgi:uncharacterized protein (TIGR02172 family)
MEKGQLIGQGRTAEVFSWGEGRILKLYQSWMPAYVVEREYNISRAVYAAGVPSPATYEFIEMEGRYGIVFERIEGVSLLAELQTKPLKLFTLARQLGELHAQIHACHAPAEIPSQRERIEFGITHAEDISDADKQAVCSYLRQLPEGEALCHGDFHPDNILMSSRGPVIIDWLTGTRGHPLADVARTKLLICTGGLPPGTPAHVRLVINQTRNLLYAIYLNRYLQLHPARRDEIERWRMPIFAARLEEVREYPQEKQLLLEQLKVMLQDQLRNLN